MPADERASARARGRGRGSRAARARVASAALAALGAAAVVACATDRAPTRTGDAGNAAAAGTPSGEAIFLRDCATCHLGRGGLIGNAALPDLLAGPLPRGDDAAALSATIRNGTGSPKMPAFRDGLEDAELAALVAWLREQRAQNAPPR